MLDLRRGLQEGRVIQVTIVVTVLHPAQYHLRGEGGGLLMHRDLRMDGVGGCLAALEVATRHS